MMIDYSDITVLGVKGENLFMTVRLSPQKGTNSNINMSDWDHFVQLT